MNDKLAAGLVTAAVITPICAFCVLGPAVVGSFLIGGLGWLGGFGPVATVGLMIVGGIVAYAVVRRRRGWKHRDAERSEHFPAQPSALPSTGRWRGQ